MRVLQVFKDYFPPVRGGIEQHVNDIVHSLEGFEFAVLTSSRTRRSRVEDDGGVGVIRASEWARPFSTPITPSWSRIIRESDADLIHFHMPNPFGELALLASRTRVPVIATYHADIIGRRALLPFFRPFQQRALRMMEKVVVNNPRLLETTAELADHLHKAAVIPFGVNPAMWEPRPAEADRLRERYPGPLILFLGRLAYYKGLDVLIEAMASVEGTLLIVGDGPKRAELALEVTRGNVERKVVFVGQVRDEERASYYHAADVFVLPSTSRAESFGISMLEGLACGTPAISTELGTGTSWVNVHGETGLVVPARDPGTLASAINKLLSDDRIRLEMSKAAMERVRTHFTRKQMLRALSDLYRSTPMPAPRAAAT